MTTMVYGRQAYEGFARAIGGKLGLAVQIADGASPCIDASGVVRLPGMNTYQTPQEFTNTCAAIVHELAHQFYASHGQIDPNRPRLEHDCLNAVLDVADEGSIAKWFNGQHLNARPGELLDLSNLHSLYNTEALHDWKQQNHAWKVLCTGILAARLQPNRWLSKLKRYNSRMASVYMVDAKKCYRVLLRARIGKADDGGARESRFPRLIKLAKELADLLQPFAPPPNEAPAPSPLTTAAGQGSAGKPQGSREATAADGVDIADGKVAVGGNGAGGGAGSSGGNDTAPGRAACEDSFRLLFPAVERIGQRIATDGDGLSLADSLSNGPVLGQAYRLVTDGQCLARWQTNEHADGVSVAVLLDRSGSMAQQIAECAGIARAFAVGMRNCGPVLCLAFNDRCVETDNFDNVRASGGTHTHVAVSQARQWLAGQSGKRWIVVITDGQPYDREALAAECAAARADNVRILAVGLGLHEPLQMAADSIVTAADPTHLAIELEAAAHVMERL